MMDTRDWILLSILFYGCVLAATGHYAFVIRRASIFEPIGQYLFFVTLFAVPLPVRAWVTMDIEGNVSRYLPLFASYLPLSLALTALSLPVFAASYYSPFTRRWGERLPLLAPMGLGATRVGGLSLVVLSIVLIYLLTADIGGLLPFLLHGYMSSKVTFGHGYLAVGFPWLLVAMVLLLDCYAAGRKKLDLLMFVVLLLVNIAIHTVTGNRMMLMYLSIVLCTFIHFRVRRLSSWLLLPVAVAGFFALNMIGIVRGSYYYNITDFTGTTSSSLEGIRGNNWEDLFYTVSIGEFVVPFETFPQVIRSVGVTEWPWMGWSFLRAPAQFIPSAIFPDRPLTMAASYMANFYGEGYGLNEGRQYFFLAEGYLNFGPLGVFLLAAVWGVVWGALHRWMQRGSDRFGTVLIYALLVGFMFRCIAGDFVSLLVGTTQQSLSAVILIFVVARLIGSRRRLHAYGIENP